MIDFSQIDKTWTLFMDRDGVINKRIHGGYVTSKDKFLFTNNAKGAIAVFAKTFYRNIVVTNQQGVGKGLMTRQQLDAVNDYMVNELNIYSAWIDDVFCACELADDPMNTRKPKPDLALQAQAKYPKIDFSKSIMIGDTDNDILFGKNLGMKTVLMASDEIVQEEPDLIIDNLWEFSLEFQY